MQITMKKKRIITSSQIDVSSSRKAVVIHVPYRLSKAFRRVHVKLVRELEKKFSGKDVILISTRRILRPPKKGSAVQRPRTVHEAMLEDIILPGEIVYLHPKERNNTEYKLETFSAVYRKLAEKDVVFEFPGTVA
ncbi:hypothetical protein E1A91_A12G290300v1 [Gossypium mustelinum]|uniref:40S ribosomal protein S7 n=1 Tax=Gossypium mustelinum TaxID=34275 RepID=A0A5D2X042_GOSMU|nr:hypothetical protein E1A91_A12G290300v1 [Gossypium mustelinum]